MAVWPASVDASPSRAKLVNIPREREGAYPAAYADAQLPAILHKARNPAETPPRRDAREGHMDVGSRAAVSYPNRHCAPNIPPVGHEAFDFRREVQQ